MKRSRVTAPVLAVATLAALSPGLLGGRPAVASAVVDGRPAVASAGATVESPSGDQRESVVVTGRGEVLGEPDTLTAQLAVETSAATVDAALHRATAALTRMRDTLVRAGTATADLQTSNVGISARRKDDGTIVDYTVNQGLTAKLRHLPRAGAILSATITAGGDAARLNGVSFTIEDDAALLAEARRKAFADARAKATLYAREAGRPLGRVVRVTEATSEHSVAGEPDRFAADSPVPVEPGRQRLAVTVTVEWVLR